MSLTQDDVLNTLYDPVVKNMEFFVGPVHVSGEYYSIIREHILAENILVVEGSKSLAFYDNKTDILTTQAGTSPANLNQKALLLHECTHASNDVFNATVTRHMDELSAYLAQFVYQFRSQPVAAGLKNPDTSRWGVFFQMVYDIIKNNNLDTIAANGKRLTEKELEPLRVQLASLPDVNYGNFAKDAVTGGDDLIRNNPFLGMREVVTVRYQVTAHESYPDPSDEYLIRTFNENYAAADVGGYGKRLRELRKDFALCSAARAGQLYSRLQTKRGGDRVSELFYDRMSGGGRAILLRVLRNRR